MEQVWAGCCQSSAGVAALAVSVAAGPVGAVANKENAAKAQGLPWLSRVGSLPSAGVPGSKGGWLLAGKAEVPFRGSDLPLGWQRAKVPSGASLGTDEGCLCRRAAFSAQIPFRTARGPGSCRQRSAWCSWK